MFKNNTINVTVRLNGSQIMFAKCEVRRRLRYCAQLQPLHRSLIQMHCMKPTGPDHAIVF